MNKHNETLFYKKTMLRAAKDILDAHPGMQQAAFKAAFVAAGWSPYHAARSWTILRQKPRVLSWLEAQPAPILRLTTYQINALLIGELMKFEPEPVSELRSRIEAFVASGGKIRGIGECMLQKILHALREEEVAE